jgi:hypothetical protein
VGLAMRSGMLEGLVRTRSIRENHLRARVRGEGKMEEIGT